MASGVPSWSTVSGCDCRFRDKVSICQIALLRGSTSAAFPDVPASSWIRDLAACFMHRASEDALLCKRKTALLPSFGKPPAVEPGMLNVKFMELGIPGWASRSWRFLELSAAVCTDVHGSGDALAFSSSTALGLFQERGKNLDNCTGLLGMWPACRLLSRTGAFPLSCAPTGVAAASTPQNALNHKASPQAAPRVNTAT